MNINNRTNSLSQVVSQNGRDFSRTSVRKKKKIDGKGVTSSVTRIVNVCLADVRRVKQAESKKYRLESLENRKVGVNPRLRCRIGEKSNGEY